MLPGEKPPLESYVYATGSWEGFHCWPAAPFNVEYLRSLHRHVFKWKAVWKVSHEDRDIEFITAKNNVEQLIRGCIQRNDTTMWSCERWARFILESSSAVQVDVSEDGENGAFVTAS